MSLQSDSEIVLSPFYLRDGNGFPSCSIPPHHPMESGMTPPIDCTCASDHPFDGMSNGIVAVTTLERESIGDGGWTGEVIGHQLVGNGRLVPSLIPTRGRLAQDDKRFVISGSSLGCRGVHHQMFPSEVDVANPPGGAGSMVYRYRCSEARARSEIAPSAGFDAERTTGPSPFWYAFPSLTIDRGRCQTSTMEPLVSRRGRPADRP